MPAGAFRESFRKKHHTHGPHKMLTLGREGGLVLALTMALSQAACLSCR